MMSNRRCSVLRGGVALGLLWLVSAGSAWGQDRLDPGFFANDSLWTPQQRGVAINYVEAQIAAIQSGDLSATSRGRKSLVDALSASGATPRFVQQFSEVVVGQVDPLVDAETLSVRLNAMIICIELQHPDALAPIQRGLQDVSAGVRFAAAQAVNNLIASNELTGAQQEKLLTQLEALIVKEDEVYVVSPLLKAILQSQDNVRVLRVLNARADWHVGKPFASYEPERTTLQSVFSGLFTAPQRDPAEVKQLARASVRYMKLAADQLAAGEVPEGRIRSHTDMILVAASSLEFAHTELRARDRTPEKPDRLIPQQSWSRLVSISEAWIELLKADPIGLSEDDLKIGSDAPQAVEQ